MLARAIGDLSDVEEIDIDARRPFGRCNDGSVGTALHATARGAVGDGGVPHLAPVVVGALDISENFLERAAARAIQEGVQRNPTLFRQRLESPSSFRRRAVGPDRVVKARRQVQFLDEAVGLKLLQTSVRFLAHLPVHLHTVKLDEARRPVVVAEDPGVDPVVNDNRQRQILHPAAFSVSTVRVGEAVNDVQKPELVERR